MASIMTALSLSAAPASVVAPVAAASSSASSRVGSSSASWSCRSRTISTTTTRKRVVVRAMADGSVTEKVKDVAEGVSSAAQNVAVDVETQAGKVASQGEDAAKKAVDTAQGATTGKADNVETIHPMETAPDGKDYLHSPHRQFSNDATRDEENQEEGPGSDPVPKDGPL